MKVKNCKDCNNEITRSSKLGRCKSCARKFSGDFKGSRNPFWKGQKVQYRALHTWINNHYGKANMCENKDCRKISTYYEWANKTGIYDRDINNWIKLCKSCHMFMDNKKRREIFLKIF